MSTTPDSSRRNRFTFFTRAVGRERALVEAGEERQLLLRADLVPGAGERVAIREAAADVEALRGRRATARRR